MRGELPEGVVLDHAYVVIDTETTGLSVMDVPVEIGAVRVEGGDVVGSFQTLVRPDRPVPAAARAVHGLDDAALADAPLPVVALRALTEFGADAIWLAHNAGYDAGILGMAYARADLPAPWVPVVDTCRLARSCIPGEPSYRLEHLGRMLGLADEGYHRALADAQVTAGLFVECVRRIGWRTPLSELVRRAGGWLTVGGVAAAAQEPPSGFEELVEAVKAGRRVELEYDRKGRGDLRRVQVAPKVLYRSGDRHYMEAFCFEGRYVKSYRLDRVSSYRVL